MTQQSMSTTEWLIRMSRIVNERLAELEKKKSSSTSTMEEKKNAGHMIVINNKWKDAIDLAQKSRTHLGRPMGVQ